MNQNMMNQNQNMIYSNQMYPNQNMINSQMNQNQNVINDQNMYQGMMNQNGMNQNAMMNGQMNQNTMTQNMVNNQMNNQNMNQNQNMMNQNQNMMNQNQNMIYSNQMYQMQMMNNQNMMMNQMMILQRQKKMEAILNGTGNQDKNNQNNGNGINNKQQQNENNKQISIPTDGSPNFTGMSIDGEYLREQEDNYPIEQILQAMNPSLNKKQFYIAVNARIRQLAIEIQTATRDFELKKQKNPGYNNQNEQLEIVKKMDAVRDLSRIIKFYFKEESEKDATQCRDYTNMDFDGLNGWIPAYTDLNGKNHSGVLSFWDPINHSAINITEDELATVEIPFLGHENPCYCCWFNAFNSMISHIPSFYLYFLKLGQEISNKSLQKRNDIRNEFPISYEIAMYIKKVNDSKDSKKQYHEVKVFAERISQLVLNSKAGVMQDMEDYKANMMMKLHGELRISVTEGLPKSSGKSNSKNSISVYNSIIYCESPSPISKMFYNYLVSLNVCGENSTHSKVGWQIRGSDFTNTNDPNKWGKNPTLSGIVTNGFSKKEELKGNNQQYCDDCDHLRDATIYNSIGQFFSSESTLIAITIKSLKRVANQNDPSYEYFKNNNYLRIKFDKKMPAFVKSGNNYFELISIGTHLNKGYCKNGSFNAPHWVSYVKDVKNDQWHFCDDKNVDDNIVDSDAKHEDYIRNDINEILKKTSKNGANYIYKKCDKSKYEEANKDIKEDISETAFDKNGKGITKSPLYLISAKAKNYALQKNNPAGEDFKNAVGSFKNRLQDQNVGILDQNGQIKNELISGNQASIINNDFIDNNNIENNIYNNDNNNRENEVYQSYTSKNNLHNNNNNNRANRVDEVYRFYTSSAENTTGRRAVFIFSAIFAVAAIILAIAAINLAIEALAIAFIIAASSAVTLFLLGCFYNLFKEAVKSHLPGGGSENSFDNNLEKENYEFMSKYGTYKNDDPYNDPNINNGNPFY